MQPAHTRTYRTRPRRTSPGGGAGGSGQWLRLVAFLPPPRKLVAEAQSYDELVAVLTALLDEMDSDELPAAFPRRYSTPVRQRVLTYSNEPTKA